MNPFIIAARLIFPLLILRFPLVGGAISVWLDNIDWHNMTLWNASPVGNYQQVDKALDMFYLSLLFYVALKFKNLIIRKILIALFILRFAGFILFEITRTEQLLFIFPNIFENLFFFYYILVKIAGYEPKLSRLSAGVMLAIVSAPKMLQEYWMHVAKEPFAVEVIGVQYELGTNYQIAYIVGLSLILGFWYRRKRQKQLY